MVHSFRNEFKKNGNVHIEFLEDSKKRRIIFEKNDEPLIDYMDLYEEWGRRESNSQNNFLSITDELIIGFINELRKKYNFIVNPNNPSVFYPLAKKWIDIMDVK